jgi:NodT family efflux transporter outer membrane factor (OMF) lipoprotein
MTGPSITGCLLPVAGCLLLSGCFLAPRYRRPPVEMPPAFKEAVIPSTGTLAGVQWKTASPKDIFPHGAWWEIFGDPQLNQLEEKVALSNQSVQQAAATYQEARALVHQAQTAFFPTVTTLPSVTRQRTSVTTTNGIPNNGTPSTYNLFELPLTAAWEPDFWGAVAFTVRTEKAQAQASAAQLQGMLLSMQAELASDYFAMDELDMETAILNSAAASYVEFLKLTQVRFGGGVASQADVAQAETQLDQTRAQATDLGITRAQYEHAIAVLIGRSPSMFSLPAGRIQSPPPPIPTGLPSELLERRPDVASAERLIVAANGQIGLARAAYFPTITLTATGGYQSNTWSNWLTWPMRFWSIGASAAETILDFGRRHFVSQQAQAAYDAQVAAYRQTVLAAFQEVEDNLAALRLLAQEAIQQDSAVKAAEKSLNLEVVQYKAGTASYLNVIQTQNIALTNERAAAQILGRRMTSAVTLVRAVGGGWDISQLPWPKNFYSPPAASTAPVTSLGVPNPPPAPLPTAIPHVITLPPAQIPYMTTSSSFTAPATPVIPSSSTSVTPFLPPNPPAARPSATGSAVPPPTTTGSGASTPTRSAPTP